MKNKIHSNSIHITANDKIGNMSVNSMVIYKKNNEIIYGGWSNSDILFVDIDTGKCKSNYHKEESIILWDRYIV